MGIRNLNKYLRQHCPASIRAFHMSDLAEKKIVIDISIYLYRYEAENALLENMYLMLSIFRSYNIIPIFIFDGKPPPEKKELLKQRRDTKEQAQEEYDKLEQMLVTASPGNHRKSIMNNMTGLKRQLVHISKEKIDSVKTLIRAYGATYYDAPGEADELCALLVIKKKAWACLSEDMDLFVYGCNRVIRYFSLLLHTAVLYFTKGIYNELNMTRQEFRDICILSGTDYNLNDRDIGQTIQYFYIYKQTGATHFFDWLSDNTSYKTDVPLLHKINKMFMVEHNEKLMGIYGDLVIENGPVLQEEIETIMEKEDFIFCHK